MHSYTEDQLVEQPAIGLFGKLGWETVSAGEEILGAEGTLGRLTQGEAVLTRYLRAALGRLNPTLPLEAIEAAVEQLSRDRSALSSAAANREVYTLLKEGVRVTVSGGRESTPHPGPLPGRGGEGEAKAAKGKSTPHPHSLAEGRLPIKAERETKEKGGQRVEVVRVVDWENAANNHFLLVSQFSVTGALYTRRPDLVGFVNGLPLVVIELKKSTVSARAAYDENLTSYKTDIPQLFWTNAFLIASNGTESRIGSLTADWERFFEWKRIASEEEKRRVSLEVMIRGTCDPARLLDLVENFTLFSEHKSGLTKILGQNHQFLGVNNAIEAMLKARREGHGRGGVFWQTQGSGKSFSMVFFAQKILRKVAGNWSFVVVTDRVELDDQIAKTFAAVGAVGDATASHAGSGSHLRDLLGGNNRYVFTLIHKFQSPEVLCDKRDVVVLTDEAHRSQYDTLAVNMRAALPNALFVAFTGTPLMAGEERTRDVFGDYVSIYDFQQSVEDGATVPLFYENRTPELQIENPDLNEDLYEIIEQADLDPDQEAKLERELSKQYHLITRDDRLETVAADIVRHFLGRGFQGKAMVVSIDKATALRMYDKVRKYWAEDLTKTQKALKSLGEYGGKPVDAETVKELQKRLEVLQTTDMAVIVSGEQNEVEKMKQRGLDIIPHRQRMNDEELDEKFKDTKDELRLVFVCAMWLTGFDAPSCSTVYLDKPMRNHTLMQTIARANRVFPGKHSGVIVDYANVFTSLEKALAIYGHGKGGQTPVRDKQKLVEDLRRAIAEALAFCLSQGVDIAAIDALTPGDFKRLEKIDDAVNKFASPDPLRKEFFIHTRLVSTLYDAVKPDPAILEFSSVVTCLLTIADSIVTKINPGPVDISKVMGDVTKLLDESITGAGMPSKPAPVIDLSKIDFEALRKRFKESKHKNSDLEVLKAAIRAQLEKLIRLNKTRVDFLTKFEELVESYNNGSRTIEELLEELLKLTRSMSEEQQRHVRENLSEEELTILDILTRPEPALSPEEKGEVKKVARQLLERLKQLLVLDWRKRSSAIAQVRVTIEDELDKGLPRIYTPDIYKAKCNRLFEHFYESYTDRDANIYEEAG